MSSTEKLFVDSSYQSSQRVWTPDDMTRQPMTPHLRRNLLALVTIITITLFLICSNTIYLHRGRSCSFHESGQSGSGSESTYAVDDPLAPESESTHPIETKSYIFIPEKNLITRLSGDSNTSKTSIDLLLNIRKLSLFAVHELNNVIFATSTVPINSSSASIPTRWWTNPLNTMALKTHSYPPKYTDHDLTFVAEPGGVPFFVRIRQHNVTSKNFLDLDSELEIKGKFYRLDDEPVAPPSVTIESSNATASAADDAYDPELPTWRRDKSFLVGDYFKDFKDKGEMYKISPGGRSGNTTETYCGSALKMLVMVSSAPKHFEHRRAIRETYGSAENLKNKGVKVVFLFGLVTDKGLQTFLEEESQEHDDLIQANFADSYHNLSLSHLAMYNWVQVTCQGPGLTLPKYILKADDDFFLNIDLALRVAYGNPQFELMGVAYCGTRPVRNLAYVTKYYTPRYMYMPEVYVGYLSGVAYVVRTDIIPRILKMSLTTPMIHMDDVYITGLVARQLNVPPMGSQLFTYGRSELGACTTKKMVSSYILSVEDLRAQWKEFVKPVPENCSLAYIEDLIKINPFRPQDNVACILA